MTLCTSFNTLINYKIMSNYVYFFNQGKAAQHSLIKQLAFEYSSIISSSSHLSERNYIRINGISVSASHSDALDRMAREKNIPTADYVQLRASAHPIQRIASMVEIANATLFMSSPLASFTTGEIQVLDGGLSTTNWFNASKLMKSMKK